MAEKSTRRVDKIQGEIIHVYDGIEEADNELPTWWLMTFYGAIAFSMVYWVVYHELHAAELPPEAYASALAARVGDGEMTEEFLVALRADPGAVAAGREVFTQNCVVCHAANGEGNIGPNLTDPNWIHGGGATDIYASIYDGRLQNGMPAWGASLGGDAVQRVAAYVLSIRGTNVEGKAAEGEVWVPGATAEEEGTSDEPAGGSDEESAARNEGEGEGASDTESALQEGAVEALVDDDAIPAAEPSSEDGPETDAP